MKKYILFLVAFIIAINTPAYTMAAQTDNRDFETEVVESDMIDLPSRQVGARKYVASIIDNPAEYQGEGNGVSKEQQLHDRAAYARLFLKGEWDGSPIANTYYNDGLSAYAEIIDGWLYVGDLEGVAPGATLSDVSAESLRRAFENGIGWTIPEAYCYMTYVWNSDYTIEFYADMETGNVSSVDYVEELFDFNVTTIGAQTYDGDSISIEHLVEMYQSGDWNGELIWCEEENKVALLDPEVGIKLFTPDPYEWEWTYVYPAVGAEPIAKGCAYYNKEAERTLAIFDGGIGIYERDGTTVAFVRCDSFREEEACIAGAKYQLMPTYVYDGDDEVYEVDIEKGIITLRYDDVIGAAASGNGFIMHVTYHAEDGSVRDASNFTDGT